MDSSPACSSPELFDNTLMAPLPSAASGLPSDEILHLQKRRRVNSPEWRFEENEDSQRLVSSNATSGELQNLARTDYCCRDNVGKVPISNLGDGIGYTKLSSRMQAPKAKRKLQHSEYTSHI